MALPLQGPIAMVDPLFLVALPVLAIGGVIALLWWRRQRIVRSSAVEEVLAVALAYALALVALHRASAPLGVAETPLFVAATAGGVAFLEGSLKHQAGRWVLRAVLVVLAVSVVLSATLGSSLYSLSGGVRLVGYASFVLLLWAAAVSVLPGSGGARPLLLALAVGAGISALSTTAGAAEALLAGAAIGLVGVVAKLAAPPFREPRYGATFALVGALWVAAFVGP